MARCIFCYKQCDGKIKIKDKKWVLYMDSVPLNDNVCKECFIDYQKGDDDLMIEIVKRRANWGDTTKEGKHGQGN